MQVLIFLRIFLAFTYVWDISAATSKRNGQILGLLNSNCSAETWISIANSTFGAKAHIAALVLARGGSKGIPLKNLAIINGKSLLKRSLLAIHEFGMFSSVWVSTENYQIADEARSARAQVHWRSLESATDSAPSIIGVQDFIESHSEIDVIGLVQCTSPFLEASYLAEGYNLMESGQFDSVFSVKREFKLRWQENADGMLVPLNFDIKNRPRRQDWKGELVENGMFYFASKELIQHGLLQGGRIGFVEIPEKKSHEIDSWYDLQVAQLLL